MPVDLSGYVQVHERIAAFREKYPDGSLQSEIVMLDEGRVVIRAYAYRTPDDSRPGIGTSGLSIPGPTTYTRGSEIENAETSAWGRALAALGFEVHRGVASQEEVAAKDGPGEAPKREVASKPTPKASGRPGAPTAPKAALPAEPEELDFGGLDTLPVDPQPDRQWQAGDVHEEGHRPLRESARGLYCPTKLDDGGWCQWRA